MDFVLKQFDDVLLNFSAKRTMDGMDISITAINKDKVERFPLGMEPTSESLTRWLRHRTIPANRAYAQNFLSKNGLSENDFIGILQICKGLSLTDCYWITYPNDQKTFAEVNLFDNRFSQVLSQIAFTGYGSSPVSKFRSSPEFTTNGMLPKAWRRKEGKVLLYKGGTSGLANTGKEPYSEFYAAQVAEAMGIPHVTYGLSKWKGQLCSTCELFTSKDVSFVRHPHLSILPKFLKSLIGMMTTAGKTTWQICWFWTPSFAIRTVTSATSASWSITIRISC